MKQFLAQKLGPNVIKLICVERHLQQYSILGHLLARLAQSRRISSLYGLSLSHVDARFRPAVRRTIGAVIDAR